MNSGKAVEALDKLEPDSEAAHDDADQILIAYMKSLGHGAKSVAEAWERAATRIGWKWEEGDI